jgi:hypothetical protein
MTLKNFWSLIQSKFVPRGQYSVTIFQFSFRASSNPEGGLRSLQIPSFIDLSLEYYENAVFSRKIFIRKHFLSN